MAMAAGMGYKEIHGRQLFFARYIDWCVSMTD
jgi:bacteriorhodopsin